MTTPNNSPCHLVTPSPCHVRPRTTPILTGTVLLAAGALLTLAACNSGSPAPSHPIATPATASQPLPPTAGLPPATNPVWNTATTYQAAETMPAGTVTIEPHPGSSATQPAKIYIVKKGDTLTSIAKTHKTTLAALKKANPTVDPNRLAIGYKLALPASK